MVNKGCHSCASRNPVKRLDAGFRRHDESVFVHYASVGSSFICPLCGREFCATAFGAPMVQFWEALLPGVKWMNWTSFWLGLSRATSLARTSQSSGYRSLLPHKRKRKAS